MKRNKRTRFTVKIMKSLYPNKILSSHELNKISNKDFSKLMSDIEKFGGFNKTYSNGKIDTIYLSPNGKLYVEKRMLCKKIIPHTKKCIKWIIETFISALTK